MDLRRWGAKFEANSQRSYFEGHERDDVVKHRRGRSHMVFDFLVQHPSGSFFELTEDEWKQATAQYRSLSVDGDVNYLNRRATAKFAKGIGHRCPVEQIEYVNENGVTKVIDCYFKQEEYKDQSKGLVELAKELRVQLPPKA
ncbi:unnamed protein product [Rotaria sordida]|nr:unnamed protein product [Rotaria sordida]